MAGAIIEQQAAPEKNIALLGSIFGISGANSAYGILDSMGITNMYNSWWFMTLLFVFAMNIIVCSLDRLPGILNITREPLKPLPEERFKAVPPGREAVLKVPDGKAEEMVTAALKNIGFTARAGKSEGVTQICAEKGRYGRLGVYVTHLSILFILTGAVVGMKFGFTAEVKLLEGMSSDVVMTGNGREIPLGFEIRCDDFDVSFYPESERPKSFTSILTVVEEGGDVLTRQIEVNRPLRHRGITFYQSGHGLFPNSDALFKFRLNAAEGRTQDISVKLLQRFEIAGSKLTARVVDFSPALAINGEGEVFTVAESMINPGAMVEFSEGDKVMAGQWILRNYPDTWETPAGVLEFRDLWGVQYTGLLVRKDPGIWLVYFGFILMATGLYGAFFITHNRIWIRLNEEEDATGISIVSSANRNRSALDRKLDRLIEDLTKRGGSPDQGAS